jgi:hypothetical protein
VDRGYGHTMKDRLEGFGGAKAVIGCEPMIIET